MLEILTANRGMRGAKPVFESPLVFFFLGGSGACWRISFSYYPCYEERVVVKSSLTMKGFIVLSSIVYSFLK